MRQPFAIAAALHLVLLLIAIFGLHLLPSKPVDMPTPISVSMVKPSEVAHTTHVDDPHKDEQETPQPMESKAPEPPKESSLPPPLPPLPVEQKVEIPLPPLPPPPEKPAEKPPEPQEKPLPKLAPLQHPQALFQQPAELPPLQKPMQVVKPTPPTPRPDQKKAKQIDQDFQSLLTNLAPPVEKADQVTKQKPVKSKPQAGARAELGNEMTADEMARVRQQLAGCWVIPAGAVAADQLSIDVDTVFNQDRTLHSAQLVDTSRYNNDPFFRAAADSVMRALRNPACNPLDLPPDKYDFWHEITLTFNPKYMLQQ